MLSLFVSQSLRTFVAAENAADLDVLRGLVESGRVTPAIDRTYSLREVAAAIRRMLAGHVRGKVVITTAAG